MRPTTATVAPCSASASATPRPAPCPAPVTSAILRVRGPVTAGIYKLWVNTERHRSDPSGPLGNSCPVTSPTELDLIDAWWRTANYLAVGQIYLLDNPLLREPLRVEHIKPRLLGHWGTTPGLNLLYAHLNRVIRNQDLNAIFVCGPGHGGPAVVASTYLEGTYTELYPHITAG